MNINSSWNFKELVYNLKALKEEYDIWIAFFLSYPNNSKILNRYTKYVRDMFYSLDLKEWQIDICWEYMNDDKTYMEIRRIFKKVDK